MPTAPVVDALDLVKTYPGGRGRPDVRALDGLTLSIPAGTVHGLLGPNGAGKSTTTKVLTTLARATSGTARVAGHDVVRDADAVRRRIGYVSQGTGADPLLTPAREPRDGRAAARAVAVRLDRPGRRAGRPVRARGGRRPRRRQALRRHAAQARRGARPRRHARRCCSSTSRPPASTPRRAPRCGQEIRRLAGEDSLTVVLTTHYLEEADRLADGLTIVDRGRVVAAGSPEALKATLEGDTLTVDLVEPDAALVRSRRRVGRRAARRRRARRGADRPARRAHLRRTRRRRPVIAALQAAGVRHGAVGVSRPTLDDVYLRHAGRSWTSADVADEGGRPMSTLTVTRPVAAPTRASWVTQTAEVTPPLDHRRRSGSRGASGSRSSSPSSGSCCSATCSRPSGTVPGFGADDYMTFLVPGHPHDDRPVLGRLGGHRVHRRHQQRRHGPACSPRRCRGRRSWPASSCSSCCICVVQGVCVLGIGALAGAPYDGGVGRHGPRARGVAAARGRVLLAVGGRRAARPRPDGPHRHLDDHRAAGDVRLDRAHARRAAARRGCRPRPLQPADLGDRDRAHRDVDDVDWSLVASRSALLLALAALVAWWSVRAMRTYQRSL